MQKHRKYPPHFTNWVPKLHFSKKTARRWWPRDYIKESEFEPLHKVHFGRFMIPVPCDSASILARGYGDDWDRVGKCVKNGVWVKFTLEEHHRRAA